MDTNILMNKRNKKAGLFKKLALFLIFELVITGVTFPLYTFYGPYKKVRNMLVGLSMSTGNHQYIAKAFLSDKQIKEIIDENNKELNNPTEESTPSAKVVDIKYSGSLIERVEINNNKFNGTALIVKDPSKVKVGYSSKLGQTGETVSDMAVRYNALAAINGGGYSDVSPNGQTGGTGGIPMGIVISDGKVIMPLEKEKYNNRENCVFAIDNKGQMFVGAASANELLSKNVQQAISFSPTLIVNGKLEISDNSLGGLNPRTAVGQRKDGSIILLSIDGRQGLKLGASLKDVQSIMYELGAYNAMCLDGGGSTAMYYENQIINNPSCITGERAVPDIVYVQP